MFVHTFEVDWTKPQTSKRLPEQLLTLDNGANRILCHVKSGGEDADLTGYTCLGYVQRNDGNTVTITGTVDGSDAYIDLPEAAYDYPGQIIVVVRVVNGNERTSLLHAVGIVSPSATGSAIDPGSVVPDLTTLLDKIAAMEAATVNANAAAYAANTAADGALGNFAPAFAEGTANAAGTYVTYTDGKLYFLPNGHTANATWANTTKTEVTTGGELSDLKSAISSIYVESTDDGDYFVLDTEDGGTASASAEVTIGNKNMIISAPDLEVGHEYTSNQVTYVKASDGSIYFHGTASNNINVNIAANITNLPAGKYTLSGCPTRETGQTFTLYGDYWQGTSRKSWLSDTGSGSTKALPSDYAKVLIYFSIPKNSSIDATVYPQLELAESVTTYEQSANQTVTANTQFAITDGLVVFARNSVTLTLNKNAVEVLDSRLSTAETEIDEIQEDVSGIESHITTMEGDIEENRHIVNDTFPTITPTTAQMVTFTDGANQIAVESLIVNLDYSSTARSKLRAFVSGKNIFNLDDVITKNHITKNQDGSISVPGTNLTTSIYTGAYGTDATVPTEDMIRMPFLPAGRYYINNSDNWTNVTVVNPSTGEQTAVVINNDKGFTLEEDSLINIYIRNTVTYIMLSVDPDLTYVQNPGKTYVVPFVDLEDNAFTMYGGTVDLVNGIATELYDSSGNELVTPVIHSITPVNVKTCLGYNHIWSDCTSVAVTYRADVKMYVDQRNKSDALEQYNIDASEFGIVRIGDFMSPNTNVIAIAHRGLSHSAPENTMPAFKAAAQAGFLVVETDVDWTSDGVPVLIHDSTINRTARNADGTEISSTISIRDITYAQALEYDFGIWKGEEFAGTKIPTFDEFILFCKRAGICPQIELKYNQQTQEQTNLLIQKVVAHGMINRVSWISNFKDLLLQVLSVHQGAYVVLVGSNESRYNDVIAIKSQYPAVNTMLTCGIDYMTSEEMAAMVARLKAAMIPMGIWTIDNSATIKSLDPYIIAITSNMLNAATVLREAALE